MTNDKLWIYSGTTIKEYNITLSPWSITFNRDITTAGSIGAGVAAKSNTVLVGGGSSIFELDITTSTAVVTTLFALPSGYQVSGDIVYNSTSGNYIISYDNGSIFRIGEFTPTGTIVSSFTYNQLTYGILWGMYSYSGGLYGLTNGQVLVSINTSTGALTSITNIGRTVYGAAQSLDCTSISFPPPSPSISATPSVTPSTTPAPTYTYRIFTIYDVDNNCNLSPIATGYTKNSPVNTGYYFISNYNPGTRYYAELIDTYNSTSDPGYTFLSGFISTSCTPPAPSPSNTPAP
jgi:hypothetical protein